MKFLVAKIKFIVPAAYLLGSVLVWINFSSMPPDGLANIGLVLYTLPVVLVAGLLTSKEFPFVEGDYRQAHAIYFIVSVVIIAVALFIMISWFQNMIKRRRMNGSTVD